MKKTHFKRLLALLLAVAALFLVSCTLPWEEGDAADPEKEAAEALAARYLARIAELEAALQTEKENLYIKESSLNARIKELEALLAAADSKGEASAAPTVFHYRVKDGKATVTGFEGDATLLQIPAVLDGYPVVAIGERAFENAQIVAVVLPEGLQSIAWFAFYGCTELVDVTVPASVTDIGHAVFDGCPKATLVCPKGSFAAEYAKSYGLPCVSG